MKAFVTKYALTKGILEVEGEFKDEFDMLIVGRSSGWTQCFHKEGRDWHRTFEAAKERAEMMRVAKRESLRKSMARLNKLDFSKARP